ncbi:hypothetical protein [Haladaptatus sp. CMAA 1909]
MYERDDADGVRVIDRWDGGVGWLAHPEEEGKRASHAVRGPDAGVWLLDPLDAPGVDALVSDLGEVVGVAVLSNWHARDAGAFARRHDVPVTVPRWLDRIEELVDAPVERFGTKLGDSGFRLRRLDPLPGWREAIAYRERDATLYVPDVLTTLPPWTVGDERMALGLPHRLRPPKSAFADLEPERVLFGHGAGIFEDSTTALTTAFSGARRRFPRALLTSGWSQIRAAIGVALD